MNIFYSARLGLLCVIHRVKSGAAWVSAAQSDQPAASIGVVRSALIMENKITPIVQQCKPCSVFHYFVPIISKGGGWVVVP